MSRKQKRIFWPLLLAMITVVAFVLVSLRARVAISAVDRTGPIESKRTNPVSRITTGADAPHLPGEIKATTEQPQSKDDPIEVEVLTLRPGGFDPPEMKRPKGRFFLAITNRTQTPDLSLDLSRVSGNKLHEVRMARGRIRSLSDLDLNPGQYVLTEATHSKWKCRIEITSK
jgi:hypothetical protein